MNGPPFIPGRKTTIATIGIVVLAWVISLAALPFAPAQIPTHWGLNGEADAYSAPFPGLFIMPAVMVLLLVMLHVLPRIDPRKQNYPSFAGSYVIIQAGILVFFLVLHIITILAAFGITLDMKLVVLTLTGLLFICLGNLLGKIRPNWFVGFRTPWTMSSPDVWTRTHRFGGRMMVAIGVIMVVAGLFLSPTVSISLVLVSAVVMTVSVFGYSYRVWRQLESHEA